MGAPSSSADLVKDFLIYFKASQHVAIHQPGVQSYLVRKVVKHGGLRCMPEANSIRKNMSAIDERVPDPKQFFIGLVDEHFSWVNSGVDTQERVHNMVTLKSLKKDQMLGRDCRKDFVGRRSACRDPVAFKSRLAAINQDHISVQAIEAEI